MRFPAPGTIIASGHSGEASLPPVLGLVRSTDAGETWEPVSGLGKADYHEIEVGGDRILALRNEDPGMIRLSDDGGKTWETREAPSAAAPIDVAVDPGNPSQWAVSTDQGTFISTNEGKSWRQRDTDLRRAHRLGRARRALQRGQGRQGQAQPRRRQVLGGRRHDRRRPEGADRRPQGRALRLGDGGEIRRSDDGGGPGRRSSRWADLD